MSQDIMLRGTELEKECIKFILGCDELAPHSKACILNAVAQAHEHRAIGNKYIDLNNRSKISPVVDAILSSEDIDKPRKSKRQRVKKEMA